MAQKIIGKVAALENNPSTIDHFYFWTDKDTLLNPFDVVVVVVGNGHHAEQDLHDDDGDEEGQVLVEVEEHGLPGDGDASFQIFEHFFQSRNSLL